MSEWSRAAAEILLNATWMATATWLAAWVLCSAFRGRSGWKASICLAALAAGCAMPAVQRLEWPAVEGLRARPAARARPVPATAVPSASPSVERPGWRLPAGPIAEALVRLWLIGALIGLAALMRGAWAARRLKLRAQPAKGAWAERGRRWRVSSTARARLLVSSGIEAPVAVGWLRPAVIFPANLDESLGESELDRLWFHEAAHLERRDDWLMLLEKLCVAVLWFHPAAWALARRLALERELACDARAAGRTGSRQDYARTLARLAELRLARGVASALSVAGESDLSRRIEMLLDDGRHKQGRIGRARAAVATIAGLAAFTAAVLVGPRIGLAQDPAPPEPPAPPAPAVAPLPAPAPRPAPDPPEPPVPAAAPTPAEAAVPAAEPTPRQFARGLSVEVRAEIRALSEELHQLSHEIQREVELNLQPMHEEMRALAEEMQARQEPFAAGMRKLAKELAQMEIQHPLTEEQQRAVEEKSRLMEGQASALEDSLRGLQEKMQALELELKPNEEAIRALEEKMRDRAAEIERRIQERVESLDR